MTLILGIDHGLHGGICFLYQRKPPVVIPMPLMPTSSRRNLHDLDEQASIIKFSGASLVAIEDVTRPAKLTRHQGFLIGVAKCAGIDVVHIRPQVWKKHYGIGPDKAESIAKALELMPSLGDTIKLKSHDGMAESFLIAQFTKETMR